MNEHVTDEQLNRRIPPAVKLLSNGQWRVGIPVLAPNNYVNERTRWIIRSNADLKTAIRHAEAAWLEQRGEDTRDER